MNNNNDLVKETAWLVQKDFFAGSEDAGVQQAVNIEELREQLVIIISDWLNTKFENLLQVFYRLDLNEQRVKQILETDPPENMATSLADLVIERQLQKAKTRLMYRQQK